MERLLARYRIGSSVGAVVALLLANAIPIVGVLLFVWNLWTILIVYWTVSVGRSGEVRYMQDIYDLDAPLLTALDGRRQSATALGSR